jgi:hypothetical protein
MIEIVLEGENVDVLAVEMKSYLETIINLINTIKNELECDKEDHRKMAIYASSELSGCIDVFIERLKKVRVEALGFTKESMSFH